MTKVKLLILVLNIALSNFMSAVLWTFSTTGRIAIAPPDDLSRVMMIMFCLTPVLTVAYLAFEAPNFFSKFNMKLIINNLNKTYSNKVKALDNNEYILSSDVPVIADDNGPQAIAGVIGSNNSSVNNKSTSIIIESAFFDPNLIRKSSKRYRLQTESSYRFERGVDPLLNDFALGRVVSIIKDHLKIDKYKYIQTNSKPIAQHIGKTVNMDLNIFDKLLGEKISQTFIKNTLSYLGFKPIIGKNKIKISVPSYRFDISIAEDLIEEVARVYGYDNFTEIPLPLNQSSLNLKSKKSINYFLDILSSRGYNEIITFTFLPKDSQHNSNVKTSVINVLNPISEDKSEMRTTMMHGLLKTAKYNISR